MKQTFARVGVALAATGVASVLWLSAAGSTGASQYPQPFDPPTTTTTTTTVKPTTTTTTVKPTTTTTSTTSTTTSTSTTTTVPRGDDGCTPGYWKNHVDSWQVYTPGQTVGSVFTGAGSQGTETLLEALASGGGAGVSGATEILLRAATAALLNASHSDVDYPRTAAEIIAEVNAALASGDRATILALATELDDDNNLGCPLN